VRKIIVVALGLAAALAAGACGSDSDGGDEGTGGNPAGTPGNDPTTPSTEPEPASGDGTQESPLGTGVAFEVGDWVVEFGSTNTDAEETIADEVGFSEPPADGRQYVMGEVTVAYTGAEPSDPFVDLAFEFYTADGTAFGTGDDDLCGLLPNDLFEVGEMSTDDSATANVCVAVPADAIDGGVWAVEYLWDLDETDRTFVAVA
jgi:hypothetical protein